MKKHQVTAIVLIIILAIVATVVIFLSKKSTDRTDHPMDDMNTMNTGSDGSAPAGDDTTDQGPSVGVTGSISVDGTHKTFEVDGGNYFFKPNTLSVNKGDTVTINFKNVGGMHDFKIDAFNASTQRISTGAQESITFVADKSGSFEFYCSVGQHRQMGMTGTLIVK